MIPWYEKCLPYTIDWLVFSWCQVWQPLSVHRFILKKVQIFVHWTRPYSSSTITTSLYAHMLLCTNNFYKILYFYVKIDYKNLEKERALPTAKAMTSVPQLHFEFIFSSQSRYIRHNNPLSAQLCREQYATCNNYLRWKGVPIFMMSDFVVITIFMLVNCAFYDKNLFFCKQEKFRLLFKWKWF